MPSARFFVASWPSITFDPVERSEADQRVADDLAALADGATKKELTRLAAGVRAAAKGYSQAILEVEPGERQLLFFFSIAAKKAADREFEFQLLASLGSFVVPVRGSIGVIGILASNTSLVEARAWQDPTNPGSELPRTNAALGAAFASASSGPTTRSCGSATATSRGLNGCGAAG